jgi:cellulose synthase/poly-beta-1,6-N-acetylglucosamine synthase-like glycosyltransferase
MCFETRILKTYGWDALTIGEDCEYYARLIQNGEVVGFDWNAKVYHQESSSLKQATSQRMRWSSGRFAVAWRYGFSLLRRGVIERNVIKFDAGLTLILPNPSLGMNGTLLCLGTALLAAGGRLGAFAAWFLLLALFQFGVFVIGVFYTKNRLSKFLAIFVAPAFLVWKLGIDALSILGVGRKKWIRTERKL